MKTFKFLYFFAAIFFLSNCSDTPNSLEYSVLNEKVEDVPLKTQVMLEVLITDTTITKQKISELLNSLFNQAIKRTGFKYHSNPTNIYIYAYTSKEKAESVMAQWIGMISKSYDEINPTIDFNESQLCSLTLKPVEKFGLPESVRLEIWKKALKLRISLKRRLMQNIH